MSDIKPIRKVRLRACYDCPVVGLTENGSAYLSAFSAAVGGYTVYT